MDFLAPQLADTAATLQRRARRIRLFGLILLGLGIVGIIMGLVIPESDGGGLEVMSYGAIVIVLGGLMVWLHGKPWADYLVTATLLACIGLNIGINGAGGTLSGSTWVLFILWPALSLLVLGSTVTSFLVAVASGAALVIFPPLEISGVIELELLTPQAQLWMIWALDLVVYMGLIVMLTYIRRSEQRANRARDNALSALETNNQALVQKNTESVQINQQLEAAVAEQKGLIEQIQQLEAPMITIGEGLVLLPLVGTIDQRRIEQMKRTVPEQVFARRAKLVVLDLTGAVINDESVILGLDAFTNILVLLGCDVRATGFSADLAYMMSSANSSTMLLERTGRLETLIRNHLVRAQSEIVAN